MFSSESAHECIAFFKFLMTALISKNSKCIEIDKLHKNYHSVLCGELRRSPEKSHLCQSKVILSFKYCNR